jgi:hypothetical protein
MLRCVLAAKSDRLLEHVISIIVFCKFTENQTYLLGIPVFFAGDFHAFGVDILFAWTRVQCSGGCRVWISAPRRLESRHQLDCFRRLHRRQR